jgi:hypothetical protein
LIVARHCNQLPLCYASSSTIHTLRIDSLGKVLKVEGIAAAVIEQVEPFSVHITSQNDSKAELKRIARRLGFQGASIQSSQLKAFARAVSADRYAERYYPPRDGVPTAAQSEMVLHDIIEPNTDNDLAGFHASTLVAFKHNCQGRSLYLTKDGAPGLGPSSAKEGDIVAVLLGSTSAMILRPTQEGNYKLVGEAYCDGFMHGEALLGPLPDSFNACFRHNPNNGTFRWAYLDQETGVFQAEDARLGPLPPSWSIKSHKNEEFAQLFVKNRTGVTRVETWDDPRLSFEALRKRGVPLQVFDLV